MERIVLSLLLALCIAHVQGTNEDLMNMSLKEIQENLTMRIIQDSKCLEKEHVTMEDVKPFAMEDHLELADDKPQLKCFSACLMEHTGIMDNCKMDIDKFANNEMLKELHTTLVTCKAAEEGGERCECAFQLVKCMIEQKASAEADD